MLNSADITSTHGDVRIDAAKGDINLEAAQVAFLDGSQHTDVSRRWYGKKKVKTTTITHNKSNAVTTDITANNIKLTSDGNINIYGSELTANKAGSINISAGKQLNLYAVDDIDESTVDVKKKSSWLGIRYNKDHTNDTRQELSQLPTTLEAEIGTMRRAGTVDGSIDFVVVYGPNKGKTVDFLFTVDNSYQKGKINQYFDNNWADTKDRIDEHLIKADIVPMDMRNIIDPRHREMVEAYVKTKPLSEQSKVIFMY